MIKHFMLGAVALYALASCTAESPIDTQSPHPLTAQNVASPTSFDYDPAHFATPDTKSENLTYLGTVNGTPAANKIFIGDGSQGSTDTFRLSRTHHGAV